MDTIFMRKISAITALLCVLFLGRCLYCYPLELQANGCINKIIELDQNKNYRLSFHVDFLGKKFPVRNVTLLYSQRKESSHRKNRYKISHVTEDRPFEMVDVVFDAVPIYQKIVEHDRSSLNDIISYLSGVCAEVPERVLTDYYRSKVKENILKISLEHLKKLDRTSAYLSSPGIPFIECRIYAYMSNFADPGKWTGLFADLISKRIYDHFARHKYLPSQYNQLLRIDNLEKFIALVEYNQKLALDKYDRSVFGKDFKLLDLKELIRTIYHVLLYAEKPSYLVKKFRSSEILEEDLSEADVKANYINVLNNLLKEISCYEQIRIFPVLEHNDRFFVFSDPAFLHRRIHVYSDGRLVHIKKKRVGKIYIDRDLVDEKGFLVFVENDSDVVYVYSHHYLNQNLGTTRLHLFPE